MMALHDAGLVSGSHVRPIKVGPSEEELVAMYVDRKLRVRTLSTITETTRVFSSLRLTHTGREIASVLAPRVDVEYFAAVGEWLSNLLGANAVVEWQREPSEDWIAFEGR
jgi:hypothetical protein